MIEDIHAVSVWIGTANSEEALEEFLRFDYSEERDADFGVPEFSKAFDAGWFDDDFREINFCQEPTSSLAVLLDECSYHEILKPKLHQLRGDVLDEPANCVVLVFNYRYDGKVLVNDNVAVRLKFVGIVQYR